MKVKLYTTMKNANYVLSFTQIERHDKITQNPGLESGFSRYSVFGVTNSVTVTMFYVSD